MNGLSKPPSFDGNDAEYQDFRFSFRIHMSLVSSVSHTLMDRCEVEQNPISLAAVRALGEAHLKCCMQMYFCIGLHFDKRQCTNHTQNRQYALMQKIMMPAKPWCVHKGKSKERFLNQHQRGNRTTSTILVNTCKDVADLGTRFWNCVWQMQSSLFTVMMNVAPSFWRTSKQSRGSCVTLKFRVIHKETSWCRVLLDRAHSCLSNHDRYWNTVLS